LTTVNFKLAQSQLRDYHNNSSTPDQQISGLTSINLLSTGQ